MAYGLMSQPCRTARRTPQTREDVSRHLQMCCRNDRVTVIFLATHSRILAWRIPWTRELGGQAHDKGGAGLVTPFHRPSS